MPFQSLTILFTPLDGWGHINACLGLAQEMHERGHRTVFAVDIAFKGKLKPFGAEEELHSRGTPSEGEYWPQFMEKYCHYLKSDTISIAKEFAVRAFGKQFEDNKLLQDQYRKIIAKVKPDVIVTDNYIASPAITCSGIPWVWLFSAAPHLALDDKRIPPVWSGLPITGDPKEWKRYSNQLETILSPLKTEINDYYVANGGTTLEGLRLHPVSPYLNVYLWPKELDYEELQPLADKWIRVENFCRLTEETFEVPKHLLEKPGKMVFLSMGSFGCANLELMTRLTTVFGRSAHKFIVSKGPLFDSHPMPDNMWGERFVPQTAVLPQVDLIITHGGNNTVTEAFYFGKPMLVLPLFMDQYDNGQRIEEVGLGLRLNPFHCSDDQLLNAIDRLVSDEALAERMTEIGERIREADDKKVVSDLIERIFAN